MAAHLAARSILCRPSHKTIFSSLLSRSFSSAPHPYAVSRPTSLFRTLRPLSAAVRFASSSGFISRSFSTRPTTSSLNDPSPNWSTRPPNETILLDGCDFEHWLVVVEPPPPDSTRDDIIDSYIKTLATILGSEEEARMKIYSVSTKHYYAFGALVSEELSIKIKELPHVRWVLPDSYLNVREKDYGGEPFIDGQAVPYDPKYHEEWVRNNARANERNRRNDRPRNFDRSRNFERRENTRGPPRSNPGMQQNNVVGPGGPPAANYRNGPLPPQQNNNMRGPPPHQNNYAGLPPHQNAYAGPQPQQNNYAGPPPHQNNYAGPPPHQNNYAGPPPHQNNYGPQQPQTNYGPPPAQTNYGPQPPVNNNVGGMPQNNMGGMPPSSQWSNNMPGNFQNGPHDGGVSHQGAPSNYQNNYSANSDGSVPVRNAY